MQVCQGDAKLRRTFVDRIMLETGDHSSMIRNARKELRSVTSEDAWYNSWEGYGNLPDYSRLRSQLQALFDAKQFDAVIDLGRELIQRGIAQVEQSQDEGETAGEIMVTLTIVAEALVPCSLTDVDKILFVIDSFLQDDYDLCTSFGHLLDQHFSESTWADVAGKLKSRLSSDATTRKSESLADYASSYQREKLSGWIIDALEASGDQEAATEFCIEEAINGGSYQRAVDRLIALKRYDEAKELAFQGLQNTDPMYAGLINRLQDSLAKIAAKQNDHSVAAALAADRFVAQPDVSSLNELLKVAQKADFAAATKEVAMHFLETGKRPEFSKAAKTRRQKPKGTAKLRINRWPFPAPPGTVDLKSSHTRGFSEKPRPYFEVLIRLAIQEHDPESVLRWYELWQSSAEQNHFGFDRFETEIADAVLERYPDRAVELYCTKAERLAAETNTSLYPESVSLLKQARNVLNSENRGHDFEAILANFRNRHRRKRRLIELLHSLEGVPIVRKTSRSNT